tara:strand:+ start:2646 stop:2948 length:303 start_codon:yes stop_codon:yes gene_type:complete
MVTDLNGNTIPAFNLGTVQKKAYTGTHGVIDNAVGADTRLVEVWASTDCHIAVGSAPEATTSTTPVTGKVAKILQVVGGTDKVSFIQQSSGGTGWVTELR